MQRRKAMAEITKHEPNTFCWPELETSDTAGAKKFYGEVLGWKFHDEEVAPGVMYSMALLGDKFVGALYALNAEMKSQGAVPHWLSYVSVTSADDTTKKAKTLGGTVIKAAFDVHDLGRMAVIRDPAEAVFAVWEPRQAIGSQLLREPGALAWNELLTNDVEKAGSFYTKLFGWGTTVQDMGGMMYTVFQKGKMQAAGMMPISQETTGDVPPNWLVYFAVADCDKAAAAAKRLGADIVAPPQDIPDVGRFAVAIDPQGAAVGLLYLATAGRS
jgi:predicted enzyme related to lactoylglutathione lyase